MLVPTERVTEVERLLGAAREPATVQLSYQQAAFDLRSLTDWPLTGALAVVCGVLHAMCAFISPRYEIAFRDMGTKLPGMTTLFLQVSDLVAHHWGWVVLWQVPVLVPLAIARLRGRAEGGDGGTYAFLFAGVLVAMALFFTHMALSAPFVTLLEPVLGAARK